MRSTSCCLVFVFCVFVVCFEFRVFNVCVFFQLSNHFNWPHLSFTKGSDHVQKMTKRHAPDVDLTEESDSETQEYVSDTEEDPAGEDPDQWRVRMPLPSSAPVAMSRVAHLFLASRARLYVNGEDHLAAVIQ